MKIASLHAENVHGYLPIDIDFFDDLTFLTGLNGSGKTSALRLLMALLTPNIDELGAISFTRATVNVHEGVEKFSITAEKTVDSLMISASNEASELHLSSAELELYMEARRRDESSRSPILEKYQSNPVIQKIKSISTPMFLGLDRRFYTPSATPDDLNEMRRREYMARRLWSEETASRAGGAAGALTEVNYLVVTRMQEVRAAQEKLDETLRNQFFAKAFEYKPSGVLGIQTRLPSKTEIDRYRLQLAKIERAAEGIKIPVPEIQMALTHFFERMSQVVDSIDKSSKQPRPAKKSGRKSVDKENNTQNVPDKDFFDWIINKPQADRILEHLALLDEYIENRNALRDPITRFLTLVNSFLSQTHKAVAVANKGQLTVTVKGDSKARSISALSSGERQLLVMLAHLSLNPELTGSGVFIVDEPELSLHIDWQEKFVDAIREANPNVQLILATHSPAIILDRVDACRTLSDVANA